MQYLNYFNIKNFKYDLINKFCYDKTQRLPKLKKIILYFNCNKNADIKNLSSSLLAFKLLISQKGKLIISKKSNISLKIKKGVPIGCKTILNKQIMFDFLKRITRVLIQNPKVFNTANNQKNKTSFSIKIKNTFNNFNELKTNYYFFNGLNDLEITFVIDSKFKNEINFILKEYKFY